MNSTNEKWVWECKNMHNLTRVMCNPSTENVKFVQTNIRLSNSNLEKGWLGHDYNSGGYDNLYNLLSSIFSKIFAKMHWLGMYICNTFSLERIRKSNFFCFAFCLIFIDR